MDDQAPPFAVDSAVPKNHDAAGGDVISPKTPPGEKLSGDEKKVWEYICAQLQAAGLDHITSGLAIRIVVKTYIRWLEAEQQLDKIEADNNGTYIIQTPNGHWQPHQAFYVTKSLKTEPWTAERLLAFVGKLPISQWFNSGGHSIGNIVQLKVKENIITFFNYFSNETGAAHGIESGPDFYIICCVVKLFKKIYEVGAALGF